MTLDETVTMLQELLGAYAEVQAGRAELAQVLEASAGLVASLSLSVERLARFSASDTPAALRAGVREYTLTAPVGQQGLGLAAPLRLLAVHLDGEELTQITVDQYGAVDPYAAPAGRPRYWYEFGGRVGFKPYPDAAVLTAYDLLVTYATGVTSWSTGENPLPHSAEGLTLGLARLSLALQDGQWSDAAILFEAWFPQVQAAPGLAPQRPALRTDVPVAPTERRRQLRRR